MNIPGSYDRTCSAITYKSPCGRHLHALQSSMIYAGCFHGSSVAEMGVARLRQWPPFTGPSVERFNEFLTLTSLCQVLKLIMHVQRSLQRARAPSMRQDTAR